jgi:Raf kinase inhibitor-like YbhB/YbcL family protein
MRRALLALMVVATACSPGGSESAGSLAGMSLGDGIIVTSPAFPEGGVIPVEYSCDGNDVSPPLAWTGVPDGTASLALVVDDPDTPRGTYTHWVVFDLDPATTGLQQGALPAGARQARNSAGRAAYAGPCPPGGSEHEYRFTLYALARTVPLDVGAGADEALDAIAAAAVARGTLRARFGR